jgi:NAD+ synthase (glutamine-hydrolysing)
MAQLVVVMAQVNPLVGDIDGNASSIVARSREAVAAHGAQVVVFPELALTGYPPEDLLLRTSIALRVERALERLRHELPDVWVLVGYPRRSERGLENVAGLLKGGELVAEYAKMELPNYQVFDEKRYFVAGERPCVVEIEGFRVALSVCEDIWHESPTALAVAEGAELVLNINASPFHLGKHAERRRIVERRAVAGGVGVVYVNQVGGQDELVFDGGSMAIARDGTLAVLAPHFAQGLYPVRIARDAQGHVVIAPGAVAMEPNLHATVYAALVTAVRDYVDKNRFKGVVLGLLGRHRFGAHAGVAVDALGPSASRR